MSTQHMFVGTDANKRVVRAASQVMAAAAAEASLASLPPEAGRLFASMSPYGPSLAMAVTGLRAACK
jgi:hypothetical protein